MHNLGVWLPSYPFGEHLGWWRQRVFIQWGHRLQISLTFIRVSRLRRGFSKFSLKWPSPLGKSCSLHLNRPCRDGFVWGCLHGLPVSSQFIFLRIHSFLSCLPTLDSHVLIQRNIWCPENFIFGGCWIFHETFWVVSPDIMQDNWWSSPDRQKMLDFVKVALLWEPFRRLWQPASVACHCMPATKVSSQHWMNGSILVAPYTVTLGGDTKTW